MKTLVAILLLVGAALPARGRAQSTVEQGERVRIHRTDGPSVVGTVTEVSSDRIRLTDRQGASRAVPHAVVTGIDRSLGRHRRFLRNLGITVGASAATFGGLAAATWTPCNETGFLACLLVPTTRSEAFSWGFAGGTVIGLPIGAIVGLAIKDNVGAGSLPAGLSLRPIIGKRNGFTMRVPFGH